MIAAVEQDPVAHVRAIWEAYARGGAPAVHEVAGPGVEWVPLFPSDPAQVSATVHGIERHGGCVLAHGSLRTFRTGGFVDVQPSWVYYFRGGRLVRAVGYATREVALSAISAYCPEA